VVGDSEFKLSLKHSLPIILGYLPVSMAFGVLASEYLGLNSVLMSALVFAGASQFAALQLLLVSSSMLFIILTTFLINLRHIMMSGFLNTYHKTHSAWKKLLIAFGITDETFAISTNGLKQLKSGKSFKYQLTLNSLAYASWVFGTFLGFAIGKLLPEDILEVLPFTLTALFLYLLVVNVSGRKDACVALIAGLLSLLLANAVGWNIVIATLVGCWVGSRLEERK
jgi:4-azaleucine resistance transporter AzlC